MALKPFCICHPKWCGVTFLEPAGETHMIWVKMRTDRPDNRSTAGHSSQNGVPSLFRRTNVVPRVDDGPAIPIAKHPKIDVVEGKRQLHPHPVDTGHHLLGLAISQFGKWINWGKRHGRVYRMPAYCPQYGARNRSILATTKSGSSNWGKCPKPSIISTRACLTAILMSSSWLGRP